MLHAGLKTIRWSEFRERENMPSLLRIAVALWALAQAPHARAEELSRKSVWDLALGEALAAQPAPQEFRAYACGSKGGAPRQKLESFAGFARCPAEPNGLHEVYFEYDDELEFIARAHDLDREINRWAGTSEYGYPVVASALFGAQGLLRGVRVATDPRAEQRAEVTDADRRKRESFYAFGSIMASRFDIEPARDCSSPGPADGESPVGDQFVKLDCDRSDAAAKRRYTLKVRLLRKPGQSGRDPRTPAQLTSGQFESSAMLEIFSAP